MRTRSTLLLLALLAALAAVAFVAQGPARRDRPREREPVFPALDPEAVQAIRALPPAGGDPVLLLARSGQWWTVGAGRHTADRAAVEDLLEDLAALEILSVASTNPDRRSLYEVGEGQGLTVRLDDGGGAAIAAFVLGKPGPDLESGHLRIEDRDEVLLVSRDLRGRLELPADSWRERKVVPLERGEITAVRVSAPGAAFVLERGGDAGWRLDGQPAEQAAADRFVDLVATLRAAGFGAPGEAAGLEPPTARIAVEAGGEALLLELGPPKPETGQVYLRSDRSTELFLIPRFTADALTPEAGELAPRAGEQ